MRMLPSPPCAVTITAPVTKQCPVKHETDDGTVTLTFNSQGETFELHELADYLSSFTEQSISHEDFTSVVATQLNVDVESTWHTAGMEVRVVVLRQPVH